MSPATRDPVKVAPVGCYLTDGKVLLEIIEVDHSGAIGVDLLTDKLVEVSPQQLDDDWRPVIPAKKAA